MKEGLPGRFPESVLGLCELAAASSWDSSLPSSPGGSPSLPSSSQVSGALSLWPSAPRNLQGNAATCDSRQCPDDVFHGMRDRMRLPGREDAAWRRWPQLFQAITPCWKICDTPTHDDGEDYEATHHDARANCWPHSPSRSATPQATLQPQWQGATQLQEGEPPNTHTRRTHAHILHWMQTPRTARTRTP